MLLRPNVISKKKKRQGRGFSRAELSAAGLSWHQANLLGIVIDRRRKSNYEENVKVLKFLKKEAEAQARKR